MSLLSLLWNEMINTCGMMRLVVDLLPGKQGSRSLLLNGFDAINVLVTQLYPTLFKPLNSTLPGSCPLDSPDKNTGVGGHSLLQGIFLTQGSNLGLQHYRWILYHLSHHESPRCY